jgi:hypothetical protein
MSTKGIIHTYDHPHGFHQPAKRVPWDVSANENKELNSVNNHLTHQGKSGIRI